jgi:hypothetical protein
MSIKYFVLFTLNKAWSTNIHADGATDSGIISVSIQK